MNNFKNISNSNRILINCGKDKYINPNTRRCVQLKNPNIKAIFASNDNMGLGAMQALKDADMNDVVVVGFDATPDAATSILKGEMTATIAQFSYNMGAYGVKYALELANGGSIDPNIDTGTQLVTKENANDFK